MLYNPFGLPGNLIWLSKDNHIEVEVFFQFLKDR